MRNFSHWLYLSAIAAWLTAVGCDANSTLTEFGKWAGTQPGSKNVATSVPPQVASDGDSIRIATFNIQVFGTTKLAKPDVMSVLTKVVRQFDVVAIQEVRTTDQTLVQKFVDMINAGSRRFDCIVGPRLGRTTSKEQYAIIFDTARIEFIAGSAYTINDRQDLLHREPLVASFRVTTSPSERGFSFSLVDIHTDPDETVPELNALAGAFQAVQQDGSGEDDVILLGDLNVDDRHLGDLGRLPGIRWVISGQPTNTLGTKQYDNIVFNGRSTAEFTGNAGIVNLRQEFGLTMDEALAISDHCPVWAQFSAHESGTAPIAARPDGTQPR